MEGTEVVLAQQPVRKELQTELKKAITAIDKKLKSLTGDAAYVYKAAALFKYNELDGNTVIIQGCLDLVYLGKALAKMKRVEEDYNKTMTDLGLEEYPVCRWLNVPISAFIEDLTYRAKVVANSNKIAQLTAKRNELTQFMSADEKLTGILASLKTLMK